MGSLLLDELKTFHWKISLIHDAIQNPTIGPRRGRNVQTIRKLTVGLVGEM